MAEPKEADRSTPKKRLKKLEDIYEEVRRDLVNELIETCLITDQAVADAVLAVPRHQFLPPRAWAQLPYVDAAIQLTHNSSLSQPSLVAQMTDRLRVKGSHRVLEVGAGVGYQAAILGVLASEVFTVEIDRQLAEVAEYNLKKLGFENVTVVQADGRLGLPEHEPYDRIIYTVGINKIPAEVIDQLTEGGILIAPVGDAPPQSLTVVENTGDGISISSLGQVTFHQLISSEGSI